MPVSAPQHFVIRLKRKDTPVEPLESDDRDFRRP